MTHYFYWYDVASQTHILDGDGSDALTTHPADARLLLQVGHLAQDASSAT